MSVACLVGGWVVKMVEWKGTPKAGTKVACLVWTLAGLSGDKKVEQWAARWVESTVWRSAGCWGSCLVAWTASLRAAHWAEHLAAWKENPWVGPKVGTRVG